ncbi:hypothetical protein HK102_000732 [Quaeritorhiza haematococci]|nr:hypothetical protein HK102_000732 [Quaeritorhiza haematococci]
MWSNPSAQLIALALALFPSAAVADVSVYQPQIRELQVYYKNQFNQKYENMRQSNIVNQQDRRSGNEQPLDMLPCRSNIPMAQPVSLKRGDTMQYVLRFNNPHDGQCEINLWKNNQTMPVATPRDCGGGFRRETFNITIPQNAPSCGPGEGCLLQFYFYSVEPRDYAACTDIVLEGAAPAIQARQAAMQPAKMFQDGYDHAMVDDNYNQYRGQQQMTQKLTDRFELEKCVGTGRTARQLGVIPRDLADRKKNLRNQIQNAIKEVEGRARSELTAGDKALEREQEAQKQAQERAFASGQTAFFPINKRAVGAEQYGVFDLNDNNAGRQTKNTYLPIDYSGIRAQFQQQMDQLCNDLQAANVLFPFSDGVTAQQLLSRDQANQIKAGNKNKGGNNNNKDNKGAEAAKNKDNKGAEAAKNKDNKGAEAAKNKDNNKGAQPAAAEQAANNKNKGDATSTVSVAPAASTTAASPAALRKNSLLRRVVLRARQDAPEPAPEPESRDPNANPDDSPNPDSKTPVEVEQVDNDTRNPDDAENDQ